jgi:hypothetical protein
MNGTSSKAIGKYSCVQKHTDQVCLRDEGDALPAQGQVAVQLYKLALEQKIKPKDQYGVPQNHYQAWHSHPDLEKLQHRERLGCVVLFVPTSHSVWGWRNNYSWYYFLDLKCPLLPNKL